MSRTDFCRRVIPLAVVAVGIAFFVPPQALRASGHGPVFGHATPTLGRGGWEADLAFMTRPGEQTPAMLMGLLAYGITENLQVSVAGPVSLRRRALPASRLTHMMGANLDIQPMLAWRFHRNDFDIGKRFESTAYFSVLFPTDSLRNGLRTEAGYYAAVATGYVSRSHYLWGGVGYQRYGARQGDRLSDFLTYSGVWAWRPPALRKDYPAWDWRIMVELVGEEIGRARRAGLPLSNSGGRQVFAGPTTLGIYKNWAVSGGVLFPVYRGLNGIQAREDFRFVFNVSYFFWPGGKRGH